MIALVNSADWLDAIKQGLIKAPKLRSYHILLLQTGKLAYFTMLKLKMKLN